MSNMIYENKKKLYEQKIIWKYLFGWKTYKLRNTFK